MTTDADKAVQATKDSLQEAVSQLANVVVVGVSGTSEFRQTYRAKLRDIFEKLIALRDRLYDGTVL